MHETDGPWFQGREAAFKTSSQAWLRAFNYAFPHSARCLC